MSVDANRRVNISGGNLSDDNDLIRLAPTATVSARTVIKHVYSTR